MAANNKIEFSVEVKDNASSKIQKTASDAAKGFSNVEKEAAKGTQYVSKYAEKLANGWQRASVALGPLMQGTTKLSRAAEQAARARQRQASAYERIGIRSERTIQREIQRTQAAYNRLARSGKLTGNELARAARKTRDEIAGLNNELGRTSKMQKAGNFARGAASVAAGVTAGGYMLKNKAQPHIDYDTQLARMANTAFPDRDTKGRIAGMAELDSMVRDAVTKYGGNRESSAETLGGLISSGAFNDQEIKTLLPTIQKYSTASGASPDELANIALSAKRQMNIGTDQIDLLLDKAMKAGDLGGFELKDMSAWLPRQFATAKAAGLSGFSGVDAVLSANQAAVISAGTKEEAGNNLVNLLAKLNSRELSDNFAKKIKIDGKNVDLAGSLAQARANGTDSLSAFVNLVDKVVQQNPAYAKVKAQAQNAQNDSEKQAALNDMTNLLEGSSVGKIIADRQALMALSALMNNRDYMSDVKQGLANAEGTGQKSFDVIASTAGHNIQSIDNQTTFAQQDNFKSVIEKGGNLAKVLSEYSESYPGLTRAIVGATDALGVFAVTLGGMSLGSMVMGGGKGGGFFRGLMGRFGGSAAATAATGGLSSMGTGGIAASAGTTASGSAGAGLMGLMGSTALAAGPLAAMFGVTKWAQKEDHKTEISALQSFTDGLKNFFGIDPKVAEKQMYEQRLKDGLGGNSVPDWYMQERAIKNWDGSKENNPTVQALSQLETMLTGAGTEMNTSAQGFTESSNVMQQAAAAILKAVSTPIPIQVSVTPTNEMFNVMAQRATQDNRRN
ncbi:phage tail tape measure protein [Neisseria sp. Ec49-e6-T10]|uniref:phage tail tape measure protein n=1 Tax=Neisseria sp. Ec49-e6-T10 TaxID=3140744 RepID=UPI003EBE5DC2